MLSGASPLCCGPSSSSPRADCIINCVHFHCVAAAFGYAQRARWHVNRAAQAPHRSSSNSNSITISCIAFHMHPSLTCGQCVCAGASISMNARMTTSPAQEMRVCGSPASRALCSPCNRAPHHVFDMWHTRAVSGSQQRLSLSSGLVAVI